MMAAILRFIGDPASGPFGIILALGQRKLGQSIHNPVKFNVHDTTASAWHGGKSQRFSLPNLKLSAIPRASLPHGERGALPDALLARRHGRLLSLSRRRRLGDREPYRTIGTDVAVSV